MRVTRLCRRVVSASMVMLLIMWLIRSIDSSSNVEKQLRLLKSQGNPSSSRLMWVPSKSELAAVFQAWFLPKTAASNSEPLNDYYTLKDLTKSTCMTGGRKVWDLRFPCYAFDARFTTALYYKHLQNSLNHREIEFSWYDWKDLGSVLNPLITSKPPENPQCQDIFKAYDDSQRSVSSSNKWGSFPKASLENFPLSSYCTNSLKSPIGFQIHRIQPLCEAESLVLQSSSFLFSGGCVPKKLVFLMEDGPAVQASVKTSAAYLSLASSDILEEFLLSHNELESNLVFDPSKEIRGLINSSFSNPRPDKGFLSELNPEAFEFDPIAQIKLLSQSESLSEREHSYLNALMFEQECKFSGNEKYKYFHESSSVQNPPDNFQNHMDVRFFSGWVPKWKRLRILNSLMRTWLEFTKSENLTSWLAHSSLHAYLYSGLQFPWVASQDVQMPVQDLHTLAMLYNQTLVVESPWEGYGRFLIDVQPFITSRDQGENPDAIDARFIDIDTGLFIDIMGVGFSSNALTNTRVMSQLRGDRNREDGAPTSSDESNTQSSENQASSKSLRFNKANGIVSEKSGKSYLISDISPLRTSKYHGRPVSIPHRALTIAKDEFHIVPWLYGPKQRQEKHKFVPALGSWLDLPTLKALLGPRNVQGAHKISSYQLEEALNSFLEKSASHYEEVLYWINSQDQFKFRLEELAIESSDLALDNKYELLETLQENYSSLRPSSEDPFLHEKRITKWKECANQANTAVGSQEYSNIIIKEVMKSFVKVFIANHGLKLKQEDIKIPDNSTRLVSASLYNLRERSAESMLEAPQVFKADFAL
ncbi:LAQU0S03e00518g1_1 [Lachancea quebecensis]|uniref:LAQU0S03e00518g1_1 n=1 Tax=Lachancea quebecensis TaxID=1654605 RepID=A0A0P1KPB8_9SACH|nr:LAQU0S03e00518g1_1 [Lachancea quebecensis]